MKEDEFIVGNWYKSEYGNYFKFLKFENGYFYCSEEIYNSIWKKNGGYCRPGCWLGFGRLNK